MKIVIFYHGEFNKRSGKFLTALSRYKRSELLGVFSPAPTESLKTYLTEQGLTLFNDLQQIPQEIDDFVLGNLHYENLAELQTVFLAILAFCHANKARLVNGTFKFLSDYFPFYKNIIWDIRQQDKWYQPVYFKNQLKTTRNQLRILAIGMDAAIGKMTLALELERKLIEKNYDAKFIATGQIGIYLKGEGLALDATIIDFTRGMLEDHLLKQHNKILLIEGQASIYHPVYCGESYALIYGGVPHKMILCAEAQVQTLRSIPDWPVPHIQEAIFQHESLAKISDPNASVAGVTLDTSKLDAKTAQAEIDKLEDQINLPVTDVIRFGADKILYSLEKTIQDYFSTETTAILNVS